MTITDSQIADFHNSLSNYGYMDVNTAIEKFQQVKLVGSDLADEVRDYAESTGTQMDKVDVCYVAYDHILQMARNKLSEVLDFDIVNDIEDGAEFYTYGNDMCTSFDYSEEAIEQLTQKLKNTTPEQLEECLKDVFVKVFLEDVEIDMDEIQKELEAAQ